MTITDRRSGSASASTASARLGGIPSGLGFKAPVYLTTTANITLNGVQTIDGVSATAGKRVLVKNQTDASENGIYVVATGNWSRATDMDTNGDVVEGTRVWVTDGTLYDQTEWVVTSADDITIDTSDIVFENTGALVTDVQTVTGSSGTIASGTAILLVNRTAPSTTALTLPNAASRDGVPLSIADYSQSVTEHTITLTPALAAQKIMRQSTWTLLSNSANLASVTLVPIVDPDDSSNYVWIIAP